MTALNEVLQAEQAAEQLIETAKKDAEAAVAAAKTEQQERLAAERTQLQVAEAADAAAQQARIDEMVQKILTDTDAQVAAIEQQFASKKNTVKELLIEELQ